MSATLASPTARATASSAPNEQWLAVMSHTDPRYGGLSAAVPQSELEIAAQLGARVNLAAFCAPSEEYTPPGYPEQNLSFWPRAWSQWMWSPELRKSFSRITDAVSGVHIHGLWEVSTAVAANTARSLGKPYILSAHGMLEPWALANKRLKKAIYGALFERRTVAQAACLHALTRAEATQYRHFGARQPIAVIPNAVGIPEAISVEPFFGRWPELRSRRLLLYLGRLHPKKGLDLLADSWKTLAQDHLDWHLVLAGPDAEGTEAMLRSQLASAELAERFTVTGMLGPELKWSALAAAEAFVLPSYSEGLSMGVLEAMGAGLPVIITQNCNLPEAAAAGAGWEVVAEPESLRTALDAMMASDIAENRARGTRGRSLVTSRYNPRAVAGQMAEVYRYVLHGISPMTAELLT